MRIALLIYSLGLGGAERVMTGLANHLAERGDEVLLVTVHQTSADAYELSPFVTRLSIGDAHPTHTRREALRANIHRALSIAKLLETYKPDVAVSFIDRMNVLALFAALKARVPIVVSERTDPRRNHLDPATRIMRRALYPRATAVVVQTEAVVKWARGRGIRNVHRIPNWVTPSFTPGPRRLPSTTSGKIVAAGRLSAHKGYDLLLEAFAIATSEHPGWTLTIYGEGPEEEDLRRRAHQLGTAERVLMPGPARDLKQAFRESDLFVLSSRFEGFPNVLLEAMASGLAVVSFACESGPQEIICDGLDGLLVPPNDVPALAAAIRLLIEDVDTREMLGRRAVGIRDRYSLEGVSALWDDLLQVASITDPSWRGRTKRRRPPEPRLRSAPVNTDRPENQSLE